MMRYSHQREVIRKIVLSTNTHPTADWIYSEARKIIPMISLGTVYRNLKQLESLGTIKTIYDGLVARYDGNKAVHNHLKCKTCGSLVDIEIPKIKILELVSDKNDFKAENIDLTITGICNKH